MDHEIWKDIKDYEGIYQISNLGRVKSLSRIIKNSNNRKTKERIRSLIPDKDGYLAVGLSKNGKVENYKVHRLVATAFIENPYNKPTVNHINGIKNDNRVENLEWLTDKEQMKHCKEVLGWKPTEKRIRTRKVIRSDGKIYNSIKEACEDNGLFSSNIVVCCQGKIKSLKGYGWSYYG